MRKSIISLIAFFFITSTTAMAQENKVPEQKPTTATTNETEKPRNEVEKMLQDAEKRGEKIYATCVTQDCVKNPTETPAEFESGRILRMPKPRYPLRARQAHVDGEVEVQIIIGEEGTVIAAAAVSGHFLLYDACVAAARDAMFTASLLNGKPVKVSGVIKYRFVAQ